MTVKFVLAILACVVDEQLTGYLFTCIYHYNCGIRVFGHEHLFTNRSCYLDISTRLQVACACI